MDPHLEYILKKPEGPSGEPPPLAPDRPSGSTGDPQLAHDEADDAPVAASPAPAPTPASAGGGTGAEADVPATTRVGVEMGVKLTWSKVGSAHLARRLLTGVAHNTPGSTPRRITTAFRARGESLGAQEIRPPPIKTHVKTGAPNPCNATAPNDPAF